MASVTLSVAAGSLLTPLRDVSLGKLIEYVWDKLSSSSPSSSGEVKIHQQLEEALEALKAANQNVKLMQTRNTRFLLEHKQNKSVVNLHKQLEDVNSEIKDLESDFEDIKLQRRMEEIIKAAEADITSQSSSGSKRLLPFSRQTVESREKKRQLSTSIQSLNLLTDDDIVRKITSIAKQISLITSRITDEIKFVECFVTLNGATGGPREHHFTQNMCGITSSLPNERILYDTRNMCDTTSSLPNEGILYGRDYEFKLLIELLLKEPNVCGNVSVIPIVGSLGIGKTALAQFVFNCTTIENHFDKKTWICVSDCFNRDRIIKEILDSVSIGEGSSQTVVPFGITTGLDLLEREIKMQLIGKKFLLVLDDVWSQDWLQLLDLLQFAQAEAIKVIVTCRDPKTLGVLVYGGNQISLKGLSYEDSFLLLLKYAFADNNSYPQQLHEIGKQIVGKLKGSPLVIKTVGRILSFSLIEKYWKDVLESDICELKSYEDYIKAAAIVIYSLRFTIGLPSCLDKASEELLLSCLEKASSCLEKESKELTKTWKELEKETLEELGKAIEELLKAFEEASEKWEKAFEELKKAFEELEKAFEELLKAFEEAYEKFEKASEELESYNFLTNWRQAPVFFCCIMLKRFRTRDLSTTSKVGNH